MPIIETNGLCKRYGHALSVHDLALRVPEGSVYGFLGPNGAGKSTTLKMILGLVRPTAGGITVFGKPMNGANRLTILQQVGSLIESPSYYGHLTGEENLRVVQTLRGLPRSDVSQVLDLVRLTGQGKKQAAHYSLGMKQRLGLAAALLGFPKLLILDEPTNGLDPAGIQEMRELIRSLPPPVWDDGGRLQPFAGGDRPDGRSSGHHPGRGAGLSGQPGHPASTEQPAPGLENHG